ncbi:MAG: endonuclease MutS2 [Vicinamibacterales bacterium]
MHAGALAALEFNRIVEVVATFALTPLGARRLSSLRPHSDARRVASLLATTSEALRYLQSGGELELRASPEIESLLAALAIEGRPLEPPRLLSLADFLASVEATQKAIRRVRAEFPLLSAIVDNAASFAKEVAEVRDKISPSGDVVDGASSDLRGIRERLRRLRARLRGTLESYLRGKETARYLQEQIVTDRNGRYVLVVRAEHRAAIPGIIHGSSTSGASLFLEPLGTVELNNEIVALEEQEAEEVRRILLALTMAFRQRPLDIQRTVEAATELDALQARARFASLVGGIEPALSNDGSLALRGARHPLLMREVSARLRSAEGSDADWPEEGTRAAAAAPVPVDILLEPPATVLVITGPNTGGKTVALKTAGLLALMAQSGLLVPAEHGSRLPVFKSIFADIGDEQSIAANLSTFSWHVTNIAGMDRALSLPALVLLDEIGAGTDPVEGGALGMAIIEHFRQRGAMVIATTHYEALKSYASTTEGVVAAGFGFEPETFAPTFRLKYGSPGSSLALEIAGRLGLNPAILAAARGYVSQREAQLAEHLSRVEENLRQLEHERRLVERERATLEENEGRLHAREEALRQREESARRRIDEQIESRLREARAEVERVVAELKRRTAEIAAEAASRAARREPVLSTGETGAVRAEAMAALDSAARRAGFAEPERVPAGDSERPSKGDRVKLTGLGLEGTLVAVHDGDAEVDVMGKRLRAPLADLRLVARRQPAGAPGRVSVNINVQPRDDLATDLNVIGCTVDEAIGRTERFLDETLLTEKRTVRLIHGHGTGQLRRALGEFLQSHPLVARFCPAPPEQGGGGVTVVELKD